MHKFWLAVTASLALNACSETTEPAATSGTPASMATTNAKVEPVPTETVKPPRPASPGSSTGASPGASPPEGEKDTCGAPKVAQFVGRQDRPTTRADLAKAVGHDNIRWIGPDDVVTMDYSSERLNVLLDTTKRLITGARCG